MSTHASDPSGHGTIYLFTAYMFTGMLFSRKNIVGVSHVKATLRLDVNDGYQ